MRFRFEFTKKADKEFSKLTRATQASVIDKLDYFEQQKNPLEFAKKLIDSKNKYRFRIGSYRVIVAKKDGNKVIVLAILKIAHRRSVYH